MRRCPGICLAKTKKTARTLRVAGLWTKVWKQDLPYKKQDSSHSNKTFREGLDYVQTTIKYIISKYLHVY